MNSLRYEDNELDFLEATAIRLGFTTEKSKFVFVQCFLKDNDNFLNKDLAEDFDRQLTKDSSDAGNTLRDCLKPIFTGLTQLSHTIVPTTQRVGGSLHQDW